MKITKQELSQIILEETEKALSLLTERRVRLPKGAVFSQGWIGSGKHKVEPRRSLKKWIRQNAAHIQVVNFWQPTTHRTGPGNWPIFKKVIDSMSHVNFIPILADPMGSGGGDDEDHRHSWPANTASLVSFDKAHNYPWTYILKNGVPRLSHEGLWTSEKEFRNAILKVQRAK